MNSVFAEVRTELNLTALKLSSLGSVNSFTVIS